MTQRNLRNRAVPFPVSVSANKQKRQASYPKLRLAVATAQAAASIAVAAAAAAADALDDIEDAPMTPVPLQKDDDVWSFKDDEEEGFHASPLKETPKAPWAPVRPERHVSIVPRGVHKPTRLSFKDGPVISVYPSQSEIDDLLADTVYAQAMANRQKEQFFASHK